MSALLFRSPVQMCEGFTRRARHSAPRPRTKPERVQSEARERVIVEQIKRVKWGPGLVIGVEL